MFIVFYSIKIKSPNFLGMFTIDDSSTSRTVSQDFKTTYTHTTSATPSTVVSLDVSAGSNETVLITVNGLLTKPSGGDLNGCTLKIIRDATTILTNAYGNYTETALSFAIIDTPQNPATYIVQWTGDADTFSEVFTNVSITAQKY